jgi:hypothetical protein
MNDRSCPRPAELQAGGRVRTGVRCIPDKSGDESGKSLAGRPVIRSDRRGACPMATVYAILNESLMLGSETTPLAQTDFDTMVRTLDRPRA